MTQQQNNTSANNKRIAKNSIFMSVRMVIVLTITLFTTRVVLNALGVVDYGIYNVVCGFVAILAFLNSAMSNGIQRFFNYEYGKNGLSGATKVFNAAIIIQITLSVLILLCLEVVGNWYILNKLVIPSNKLVDSLVVFQFSIICFMCTICQAPFAASIIAHERIDFLAMMSVADSLLKLTIAYLITILDGNLLVLYGALLALESIIIFMSYIVFSKRNFKEIKINLRIGKDLLRPMLSFSGWNLFGSFSGIMKEQGINLILNLFFGPTVNAARAIAFQVSSGLSNFVQNLSVPIRPQVIQEYAISNFNRSLKLTFSLSKLSSIILYVIALPVLFEIDTILCVWLGDDIPQETGIFVIWVVLTAFINNLNSSIAGIVHASGKMKKYQLSGAIVNLLSLPIAYFLLKIGYDAEYALITVFIITIINQIVCLMVMREIINYSFIDYVKTSIYPFVRVVVLTIWIPFVFKAFIYSTIIRLLLNFFLLTTIIIITSYFSALTYSEKAIIKNLFSKLVQKFK